MQYTEEPVWFKDVILYAKLKYPTSGDVYFDLNVVISRVTYLPQSYYKPEHILNILAELVHRNCDISLDEWIKVVTDSTEHTTHSERILRKIDQMFSLLQRIQVREIDRATKETTMLINLGEVDLEITEALNTAHQKTGKEISK